jgi:uncharacterized protein YdaT
MATTDVNTVSTPMAPDINAAARAERDKAIAALDVVRKTIDDQWSSMTSDQKVDALKQINDITNRQSAIAEAFVENIFNSKAHQDVIKQMSDATKNMNDEAKKITDVASRLTSGAKILGYAAQVAVLFASLAG